MKRELRSKLSLHRETLTHLAMGRVAAGTEVPNTAKPTDCVTRCASNCGCFDPSRAFSCDFCGGQSAVCETGGACTVSCPI